MRFNSVKATEPLGGGNSIFTINFPEIPGNYLINLGRMKAELMLKPPSGSELVYQPSYYQI